MCFCSECYYDRAEELHERERDIKATRGLILDARGKVLASNRTVCTVSVIHSQIRDPEKDHPDFGRKAGNERRGCKEKSRKDFFHREDNVPMWIKVQEMLSGNADWPG